MYASIMTTLRAWYAVCCVEIATVAKARFSILPVELSVMERLHGGWSDL